MHIQLIEYNRYINCPSWINLLQFRTFPISAFRIGSNLCAFTVFIDTIGTNYRTRFLMFGSFHEFWFDAFQSKNVLSNKFFSNLKTLDVFLFFNTKSIIFSFEFCFLVLSKFLGGSFGELTELISKSSHFVYLFWLFV